MKKFFRFLSFGALASLGLMFVPEAFAAPSLSGRSVQEYRLQLLEYQKASRKPVDFDEKYMTSREKFSQYVNKYNNKDGQQEASAPQNSAPSTPSSLEPSNKATLGTSVPFNNNQTDAIEFLKIHVDESLNKISLAKMQLDIVAASPVSLGFNFNLKKEDFSSLEQKFQKIREKIWAFDPNDPETSDKIFTITEEIRAASPDLSEKISEASTLFAAQTALSIKAYAEDQYALLGKDIRKSQAAGNDVSEVLSLLETLQNDMKEVNRQYDMAVNVFKTLRPTSKNKEATLVKGQEYLKNMQKILQEDKRLYRDARILLSY
ncbi:hypothetical protein HZA38_05790 [Candidatus Peregrinibacteria bacterium]|nr:hypothetical protein [Candidatus Peregrinibacteria bacterium]